MNMSFNVAPKILTKALEDIQGKGMYLGDKGFSNSKLTPYVYMELEGNNLTLWNGDTTCGLKLSLEVEGHTDGSFTGSAETIVPYLKKFSGDSISVAYEDCLHVGSGHKTATIPAAVQHPNFDAITRIRQMIKDIEFETVPRTIPDFGSKSFEGAFQLTSEVFDDAISGCELVKSGVYLLDYFPPDEEKGLECALQVDSNNGTANSFCQSIRPLHGLGEPATLQYSGPLHKFFKDQPLINFYVKDDFPLLIVGHSKMAVKAPYTRGD